MTNKSFQPGQRGGREQEPDTTSGTEPRFLTLADVARYLAISSTQAYALVRSGELPAIKLGGRGVWRVDRYKLESYLERLEEETRAWTETHPLKPDPPSNGPPSSAASSGGQDRTPKVKTDPPSVGLASLAATSGGEEGKPKPEGPSPLPEGAEVVTVAEAAGIIGVTVQNVHHLIKTGRLRAQKQGRRWVVSAEDVRSYQPLGQGRSQS